MARRTGRAADERWLRLAVAWSLRGVRAGQTPFGSVIVRGGELLAAAHNTVHRDRDPTAHAEVNAVRAACRTAVAIKLPGTILYSSCEPCPMCLSAIHWAGIDEVVYAATIADARAAGFDEIALPAARVAEAGGGRPRVRRLPLPEALHAFAAFGRRMGKVY